MAITLLSIAIVLLLTSAMPELAALRQFDFQNRLTTAMHQQLKANGFWHSVLGPLLAITPAVLVIALLQQGLAHALHGLLGFVFGMVVLFYTLGPRELSEDLHDLLHAHKPEQRVIAQRAFAVQSQTPLDATQLIEPIFTAALKRKFAVLFWFAVFGAAGALAYRLLQLLADETDYQNQISAEFINSAKHLESALAWIPAQLMCAALALASDFDAVARAWREHQESHQRGWLDVDLGFLARTAKACMDIDDVDPTNDVQIPLDHTPIQHAQQLLGRISIAWLLGLAILVLAVYLA